MSASNAASEASAAVRAWREANPDKVRELSRAWREKNPELTRWYSKQKKMRRRAVAVEHVESLVVLELADGVCGICGKDVDPLDYHVDHIVPITRGGEHSYANTQPAHPACNQRKHSKLQEEMA